LCQQCVIDDVKRSMISRRSALCGLAGAVGLEMAGGGAPAFSQSSPRARDVRVSAAGVRDLTHELHPDFPTFFGERQFAITQKSSSGRDGFNLNEWVLNEHTGTHIDAPLHFAADGKSVAELPIEDFVAPLVVIDIRMKASSDADAQLTPDDVTQWVARNGPVPDRACIAMLSGWDAHVATPRFRNADDRKVMHFPGFHAEAVEMLLETTTAVGIASDTLSLDHGASRDFAAHKAWLPRGKWGIEAISGLARTPERGAMLVVGAPKVRGATGGPIRAFAFV
jgi:kynurenine formamidase